MRAGQLRHRVRLQRGTPIQNPQTGEETLTWTDVAWIWAVIEPLSGREYFAAQAERADLTHQIRLRYRSDIVPKMRITYEGRVFDIESPPMDRDGRRRELAVLARERVG